MRIIEGFSDAAPRDGDKGDGAPPAHTTVQPARQTVPFVFNSPHSGQCYPRAFVEASRLDRLSLRRSEDTFVDELFAFAPALGAPLLKAEFPRAFLDVNREPYELDPAMFEGALPRGARTATARVAAGLGTIARVVADNREIYRRRIPVAEALARVETLYMPYHAALRTLLSQTRTRFGFAVLIDCHSMPSGARGVDPAERPDVIIGDRFGTSCAPAISADVASLFAALGYRVGCNRPYAGGYITERYGAPQEGVHVVQLELNRGLYMDEATLQKTAGFDRLRTDLSAFAAQLMAAVGGGEAQPLSDAAE